MRARSAPEFEGWIDDRRRKVVAVDPVTQRADIARRKGRGVEPRAEQCGFLFGHQQTQVRTPRDFGLVGGKQATFARIDRLERLPRQIGVSFELGRIDIDEIHHHPPGKVGGDVLRHLR